MSASDNAPSFWDLHGLQLQSLSPAEWEAYYPRMAGFLTDVDASIRDGAIERLCMAVFWAERMSGGGSSATEGASLARLDWLLGEIEAAAAKHVDVKDAFLDHMRYHGDGEPFAGPVTERFRAWLKVESDPDLQEKLRGAIVLHEPEGDAEADIAHLIALLDDTSDYVRACAAHRLGERIGECNDELFAFIGAKDIERPGVAGPFWSACKFMEGEGPDAAEWMLNILANRNGPEPEHLPFNGVDFHLHEICDGSPESVEMMLRLGHKALAAQTATERRGVVPGMETILRRLGDDPEPEIAKYAVLHLAFYYAVLHPRAGEFGVASEPDWDSRVALFRIDMVVGAHTGASYVLYAKDADGLSEKDSWALVDRLVSPERRGALEPHDLSFDDVAEPYRLGSELLYKFANASVEFWGDPDTQRWKRIEIMTWGARA
ncbi:hypothetical protein [Methylocystis parvus]|uniref:hypothetical protein n=1 Tax=Methylocystis parvus TaxID=134 RepID=UPI003C74586B